MLLALSGWEYDGPKAKVKFAPGHTPNLFSSFFTGPEGWGRLQQSRQDATQRNEIHLVEGRLPVAEISLECANAPQRVQAEKAGQPVNSSFVVRDRTVVIAFDKPLELKAGENLAVRCG
jgi:hypothetical protein